MEGVYTYNKEGTHVEPGQVHSAQDNWATLGAFASATTTPDNANRTASLFAADAKNVVYTIPSRWNTIRIRCSSTTDADTSVFDVFLMNGADDHFNRIATLTFTTGTQTAPTSGYEFADTVVQSNANWHKNASVMSPVGNYIAEWSIDVLGSRTIGISPTTITNAAILEITGF